MEYIETLKEIKKIINDNKKNINCFPEEKKKLFELYEKEIEPLPNTDPLKIEIMLIMYDLGYEF